MKAECETNSVVVELDELALEVRRVIDDNRKFLERIMDDEFEPEDDPDEELSAEEL
mgnify:CR=1 FL=1